MADFEENDGTVSDGVYDGSRGTPSAGTPAGYPDPNDVPESRKALVAEWIERVKVSKKHFKPVFDQMAENQYLAAHGATREWTKSKNYVVALLNRHLSQAVSALYSRDPKADCTPRKKLRYAVWDGRNDTLQAAMQQAVPKLDMNGVAVPGDPNALAIIQDVIAGRDAEDQARRIGQTVEILWEYFTSEQENGFRKQLKALVRRAKVCKIGYIKLGFQRVLEPRPEVAAQIEDATSQLSATEQLLRDMQGGDYAFDEQSARAEELRLLLAQFQDQQYLVVREGPVFDFPRAAAVIVDKECFHLKTFAGARWIAHEFELNCGEIEEIYGCKVEGYAKAVKSETTFANFESSERSGHDDKKKIDKYRIWEIQDKKNSQFLTVCEGYPDFLKEPAEPDVKIDRFWTIFPLIFNEIESDKEIYPLSDIELLKDTQDEYNRARQGLREHRKANRPMYFSTRGALTEDDKTKLSSHEANAIIELANLMPGQDIDKIIVKAEMIGIDPNQYDVGALFADMARLTGSQEEDLGAATKSTATSASIVAQGRATALTDNIDDLDETLSDLAKATGQLLLAEMSKEMVTEIVGPGAVWPDAPMTRQQISQDLILDIKAGSSGRPNAAAKLANLERVLPFILQMPGVSPVPYARLIAQLSDIDIDEATAEGAPSVMAMNAILSNQANAPPGAAGQPGGAPPGAQGPQGHAPAPNGPVAQGAPMPAPGPGTTPSDGSP